MKTNKVLILLTSVLISCGNEYSFMPVPMLNKESVIVTRKTGKDTIYSYNDVNFVFHKVWLHLSDGTDYIDTQKDNRNGISDGQNVIGTVEYEGDESTKIEIPDWCVITRFKSKKQYAYTVEAIGRKDLHTSLILPYAGGAIEIK